MFADVTVTGSRLADHRVAGAAPRIRSSVEIPPVSPDGACMETSASELAPVGAMLQRLHETLPRELRIEY